MHQLIRCKITCIRHYWKSIGIITIICTSWNELDDDDLGNECHIVWLFCIFFLFFCTSCMSSVIEGIQMNKQKRYTLILAINKQASMLLLLLLLLSYVNDNWLHFSSFGYKMTITSTTKIVTLCPKWDPDANAKIWQENWIHLNESTTWSGRCCSEN